MTVDNKENQQSWFQTADLNVPIIVPAIVPAVIGHFGVPIIVPAIVPMVLRTVGLKAFVPPSYLSRHKMTDTARPETRAIEVQDMSAPNRPVKIAHVDKQAGVVTLHNISSKTIDLTGWKIVCVETNQIHQVLRGTLLPGDKSIVSTTDKNIWNADRHNDGALYDEQGKLISYWNDPM